MSRVSLNTVATAQWFNLYDRRCRGQAWAHTVSAPTQVGLEPGAAGRLLGDTTGGPTLRLRVPGPWLVRRKELRTPEKLQIVVLHLRPGRQDLPEGDHRGLRVCEAARTGRTLPGTLRSGAAYRVG